MPSSKPTTEDTQGQRSGEDRSLESLGIVASWCVSDYPAPNTKRWFWQPCDANGDEMDWASEDESEANARAFIDRIRAEARAEWEAERETLVRRAEHAETERATDLLKWNEDKVSLEGLLSDFLDVAEALGMAGGTVSDVKERARSLVDRARAEGRAEGADIVREWAVFIAGNWPTLADCVDGTHAHTLRRVAEKVEHGILPSSVPSLAEEQLRGRHTTKVSDDQ